MYAKIRLVLAGTRGDRQSINSDSSASSVVSINANTDNSDVSELVQAVSRTGNKAEALGGPLIYSIVLLLGTLLFFRFVVFITLQ